MGVRYGVTPKATSPFFLKASTYIKTRTKGKKKNMEANYEDDELKDFSVDVKRDIIDIINDSPSLVRLGDKEYTVKNMRFYSVYRIARLCMDMRKADETLDDDNKILTALCTDLDAMSEIMAIVLCNHRFRPDDDYSDYDSVMTRNDKMIKEMKMVVMNSTFEINQWAAIIIGALKSIDLSGFFLLKKSVSTLMDSLLMRKKKSEETVSQFTEALSLRTQPTS